MLIPELNQYSIKLNNLTLRGNFSNIYSKKMLQNERIKAHQVTICMQKNNCCNILSKKYCKFWHDPLDLLELKNNGLISEEFYQETIQYTRNFSNTAWIYSNTLYRSDLNRNMRSIGSKSSLINDIALCKISPEYKIDIENMKHQVMHDLLVLLVLNEHSLT